MRKILGVDDNPVSRELIREVLEGADRNVLEAANGKDALELIAEAQPDLVLMDIQMPLVDGFAALRRLRQDARFQTLPVIALTAFAMRGDREKALAAGFDAYIAKPVNIGELEQRVNDLLA